MAAGRSWRLLLLSALIASTGAAATRAYFVDPKTAANGWTEYGPGRYVGQTFVANVDSIRYIEWFVGERNASGKYEFSVLEDGIPLCEGEADIPSRGWQWVRCSTFTGGLRLTKGRSYLLKVNHDGGDSVSYVYRADNPYGWGEMEISGGQAPANSDLCARVVGVMDLVTDDWWGANVNMYRLNSTQEDVALGKAADSIGLRWMRDDFVMWDLVGARPATRNFTDVNAALAKYAGHGLDVLSILCYSS